MTIQVILGIAVVGSPIWLLILWDCRLMWVERKKRMEGKRRGFPVSALRGRR